MASGALLSASSIYTEDCDSRYLESSSLICTEAFRRRIIGFDS